VIAFPLCFFYSFYQDLRPSEPHVCLLADAIRPSYYSSDCFIVREALTVRQPTFGPNLGHVVPVAPMFRRFDAVRLVLFAQGLRVPPLSKRRTSRPTKAALFVKRLGPSLWYDGG